MKVFAPTHVEDDPDESDDTGRRVSLSEGEAREAIDFNLEPGAVITGTVTDSSGRPLIREFLTLHLVGESGKKAPLSIDAEDESMFYTDDRGIYRIYGIPAGRYLVTVGESSGRAGMSPFFKRRIAQRTFYPGVTEEGKAKILGVAPGAELTGIDIRMAPPGRGYVASGRVIESQSGKPISNTMVFFNRIIKDADYGTDQPGTTASNAQGEFRLENLQQGTYMAGVFFTGQSEHYAENITFEVKNADVAGLEIKLHRGGSIEGTVSVDNSTDPEVMESLARLFVMARVTGGEKPVFNFARGKINPDGTFRVSGLAAGRVQIMVEDYFSQNPLRSSRVERDGVAQPEGITIGAGEHISGVRIILAQASSSIRGQVVFEGGSLPAGTDVTVLARRSGAESIEFGGGMAEVQPNGSFVIEKLHPGDYELEFFATPKKETDDSTARPPLHKQTVTVNTTGPTEVTIRINIKERGRD
ncbi:MAG TPA: carboxypeptidase-like regulatory domain-containing protein [Blastocatellia bacterium]|nr:carboxypeptidase-like regulatory domain-containing protein [Blastocatellia bacterium]